MREKIRKYYKIIISALTGLVSIAPFTVNAGLISMGADAITFIVFFQFYIIQYISGFLFSLAGYFTGRALDLNYGILSQNNALVFTGWTIVRDIANLGFVMVIIIIAISTILRYKEYGSQQVLKNLIIAAIAVNFSLTIAGVLIDFSHTVTRFFFKPLMGEGAIVGGGPLGLGVVPTTKLITTISGAFNPQKLFAEPDEPEPVDPDEQVGGLSGLVTGQVIKIAGLFFTIIFTLIATFVIFALGVLLFLRYLNLSFLLVVSPIVYLLYILPNQKSHWNDWWTNFTKWLTFAPASAFFVYLAIVSIQKVNDGFATLSPGGFFKDGAMAALAQQGVNMIILCGFLTYGLVIAQQAPTKVAGSLKGYFDKQGGKVKNWARAGAARTATAPLRTVAGRATVNKMQVLGQGKWWGGAVAPVRRAGHGLSDATMVVDRQVEGASKKYGSMAHEELGRRFNQMSAPDRVWALKKFADDGKRIEREHGQAQARKTRAEEKETATKIRLEEIRKENHNKPEEELLQMKDYSEAKQAHLNAQDSLQDAGTNFAKIDGEKRKFESALGQMPSNIRSSLKEEAKYDLMSFRSPRTPFLRRRVVPVGAYMPKVLDVASNQEVSEAQKNDSRKSLKERVRDFVAASKPGQIATLITLASDHAAGQANLDKADKDVTAKNEVAERAKKERDAFANYQEVENADKKYAEAREKLTDETKKRTEVEKKLTEGENKLKEATKKRVELESDRDGLIAAGASSDLLRKANDEVASAKVNENKNGEEVTQLKTNLATAHTKETKAQDTVTIEKANDDAIKAQRSDYDAVLQAIETLKAAEKEQATSRDRHAEAEKAMNGVKDMMKQLPKEVGEAFEKSGYDVNKMKDFIKGYEGYRTESRTS